MKRNGVGVFATINAPSDLTREEKVLRVKKRSLDRELRFQKGRVRRFREDMKSSDPVTRAASKAEYEIACASVVECELALENLSSETIN